MSTRRKFLLNCSAAAVTASVAPVPVFGAGLRYKEVSLEKVSFAAFASHVKEVFQVQDDSGFTFYLQLVEATRTTPPIGTSLTPEDSANEKFSLLFRGLLKQPLAQGTYWFEHARFGRFAMFIVPIGSTKTTESSYEAIFNRPLGGRLPRAGEGNIPVGFAQKKREGARGERGAAGLKNLN